MGQFQVLVLEVSQLPRLRVHKGCDHIAEPDKRATQAVFPMGPPLSLSIQCPLGMQPAKREASQGIVTGWRPGDRWSRAPTSYPRGRAVDGGRCRASSRRQEAGRLWTQGVTPASRVQSETGLWVDVGCDDAGFPHAGCHGVHDGWVVDGYMCCSTDLPCCCPSPPLRSLLR